MTISSTALRSSTAGNGSTTAFTFPYLFFAEDDLTVILVVDSTNVETTKTITTHYTVAGAGVAAGGTVTMGSAPAVGETLVILRDEQFTQGLDLVENDPFPSDLVEKQFDILTMLTQRLKDISDRSVKLSDGDTSAADTTLATPVANAFIKWNTAGTALTSSSTAAGQNLGGDGTVLLPYYSYSADPNSGAWRVGADQLGWSVNGVKGLDLSTTGLTVTGTLAATAITGSGILSIDATTESTSGTTGSIHTDGGLGVAKKLHVVGTTTHGGNILSDTDSTDSLGSTGVRWLKLWVDDITATTAITAAGVITGLTLEATGDTAAGDNSALGYTSGEGAILTGQGSATDVTIKNDADATVISVPTGTTNTTFGGTIASDTDSTDDIGTTGVRWKELFVDDITMGGDQTIGGNLTITGNLTINGTTVTNDATNVTVKDFLIEINSGASTNANDMGIIMERGSTGDNAIIMWDESGDYFQVGTTTATGGSSGDLTVADGQLHAAGLTLSATSSSLGAVTTMDLNGGTIDGAVIGGAAAAAGTFTDLASTGDTTIGNATGDALTINPSAWTLANAVTVTGTWTNLGTVTTANIDGGTLDGSVIGGASAAAITGTTLTANTSITLATGGAMTGVLDSDTMTGATAALLSTSESIKAYVDNTSKAPGISMTWETATTDTDQGVGKVWANNATLSSATVLYFDDVERNSVSINALIDSLDDPTATNSATIYIQEAGSATAGVLFQCSGSVTSASTYSKVAVTHQATFGTLSDGDVVGVTFAFSGDNGAGSGTVTQINAGAGFSFSAITTTGTIAVDGVLQDLDALGAPSSDGQFIVATGSGAFNYESGATAFTSIKQSATTSATGVVEQSTSAENLVGTADDKFPSILGSVEIRDKRLAIPASDHTANGPQTNTLNAGYTNALFDLVYLNASGKWLEADADATGTSINMLGLALEVSSDTNSLNVALPGCFVRDDTWAWTIGAPLYISGTLGAMTHTAPSGSGDIVRVVAFAITADVIYFNPSQDYLVVA